MYQKGEVFVVYSKIVSIEVFNFMVYEHAKVLYDERGIINLKGYNSSGKSTILRALAVCTMDHYRRSQTKFIRHGEDYFRIVIEFDDGVKIVRDKYINGQSLYEMYQNGELLFTTKEGSRLTKIDGVPQIISEYLGLVMLENGCLNYQTRHDPLWLIDTPGSENYYALNEVLKTESIARANTLLNSDKNKLGGEIAEIEAELQSTELALQNCGDVSEELIIALTDRENKAQGLCNRLAQVQKIAKIFEQLEKLKPIPVVEKVKVERLNSILEVQNISLEMEKLVEIPKVKKLDIEKLQAISRLSSTAESLEGIAEEVVGAEIKVIDYSKIPPLSTIQKILKQILALEQQGSDIENERADVESELQEVVKEASKNGISFIQCDNCGTYMEVKG